jgi:AbrB family looped-hinge helix DNA binding protein
MNVKLSTKGQLVIPKEIRRRHGWRAGSEVVIVDRGDHLVIHLAGEVPRTTLDDVVGCTGYKGPRLSEEEMEAGIARGARRTG